MTQLPPVARSKDPSTSYAGAAEVTDSGRRVTHATRILAAIRAHPGKTSGEYAELVHMELNVCEKRVSDLKNQSLVYPEGKAQYHGNWQRRWWPVPEEPRQGTLFTLHGRPT